MNYDNNIDAIVEKATIELKAAPSFNWLERVHNEYLGQNGILPRSLKSAQTLPSLARDERIQLIEHAINAVTRSYNKRNKELKMVK